MYSRYCESFTNYYATFNFNVFLVFSKGEKEGLVQCNGKRIKLEKRNKNCNYGEENEPIFLYFYVFFLFKHYFIAIATRLWAVN